MGVTLGFLKKPSKKGKGKREGIRYFQRDPLPYLKACILGMCRVGILVRIPMYSCVFLFFERPCLLLGVGGDNMTLLDDKANC